MNFSSSDDKEQMSWTSDLHTMSQSAQSTLWSLAERIEDGGKNEEAGMGEWREGLGDWREGALDEGGV